jgi:hypothetical protein
VLRSTGYKPPAPPVVAGSGGGGDTSPMDYFAQAIFEQAKALYRYWPEVDDGRLFDDS